MDDIKTFLKENSNELQLSPTAEENIHPKIVSNYCLGKEDVYNQVIDWALHYLENKKCPYQLAVAIAKITAKQIDATVSEQLLDNSVSQEKLLNSHALYTQTLKKLLPECQTFAEKMEEEIDCSSPLPFVTSSFEIKNKRRTMEDRHVIIHDLNSLLDLKDSPVHSYYAVFDGHNGVDAASYASAHLHVNMASHPDFLTDASAAIAQSYKVTDENFLKKCKEENLKSGCTAVCALIRDKRIYLSWAGDSQAVLVKGGRPVLVTESHKPDRPDERKRVEDAGGSVDWDRDVWRVNGMIAISRALGDADYRPYISSEPEMTTIDLDGNEDFLVLACDGLFDCMTPEEVTSSLYQNFSESAVDEPLDTLAAKLTYKAKEQGSEDNITTIVVFLRDLTVIRDYASELLVQGTLQANFLDMNGDEKHESPCKPTVLELNAASTKKLKNTANVLSSAGFQCPPVYSEGDFDSNMFQNSEDFVPLQNALSNIAPEATALSELPTPPIDDVVASQKFGNICPAELFQGLNSISTEKCALVEEEANAFNSGDFESMVNVQQPPCDQVSSETLIDSVMSSDFQSIVNPFQDQIPSEKIIETSGNNDFTPDEAADVASCVVSNTIETAVRCLSSNEMFEPSSPVSPISQLNPFAKPFIPGEMLLQGESEVIIKNESISEDVFSKLEETNTIETEASENNCKEQASEDCSGESVAEDSSKDTLKEETTGTSQFENVLEFNDDNGSKTLRVSSLTSRFSELSILSPQLSATVEKDLESEISNDQNIEPSLQGEVNKSDSECPTNSPRTWEIHRIFDKPLTYSDIESMSSMAQTFTNNSNSTNEGDIGEKREDIDSTNILHETVDTLDGCEINLLENVSVNDQSKTSIVISKSTSEGDTVTHGEQITIQSEDDHVSVQVVQNTNNAELLRDSLISIDTKAPLNAVDTPEIEHSPSDVDITPQNIEVADKLVDNSAMEVKSPTKTVDAGFNLESVTFESLNLVGVDAVVTSTEEKLAEEGPVEAVDLQTVPVGVPEAEGVTEDIDSDSEKDGGWSYMKGNTLGKSKPQDPKPKADKLEATPKLKKDVTKAVSDNKTKVRTMTATDKSKKPMLDKVLNVKEKVKPTRTVSSTLPRDISKSTLSKGASKPMLAKSASDKLAKPSLTLARVKKEAIATVPGTKARTASSTLPKDVSNPTLTKSAVDKSAKPASTFARIKKEASATTKVSSAAATTKPSRPTTLRNAVAASKPQAPLAKDRVFSATVKTTNTTTVHNARPKSALATNGVKGPTRAPILPRAQLSLQSKVAGSTSTRSPTTLSRPASATVPTRALTKPSKPIESKVKPVVSTIKRIDPKKSDVKETKDIVNKQIFARKNLTPSTLTRSETIRSATTSNKRAMTLSNKPVPSSKTRSVPLKNEANKKDVPKSAGSRITPKANILKSSEAEKGCDEKASAIEGNGEKNLNELATPVDSSSQVVTPASEEEKFLLEVNNKEIQSVQEKEKDEIEDQQPHCLENGLTEESVKPLEGTLPGNNHVECSAQNV